MLNRFYSQGLLATLVFLAIGATAVADQAFNSEEFAQKYFTINEEPFIQESELDIFDEEVFFAAPVNCAEAVIRSPLPENPLEFAKVVIDQITQIGAKIWSIVEKNKPVLNLNLPTVSAIPQGIQCWNHLEGWSAPMVKTYRVDYENLLGMSVVSFEYKVVFSHSGSFQKQGQYLANVAVLPADVSVLWGFTFNAEVQVGSVMNLGSSENPEAGVQLNVNWRIDTPFQANEVTDSYFVKGRGEILAL